MADMYSRSWTGEHPGCLIILLDQSGSMYAPFGRGQAGAGKQKCDAVAMVLNSFLNELISINTVVQPDGSRVVRPCADIVVLGYEGNAVSSALGGELAGRDFVTLPELQRHPIDLATRKMREIDDAGKITEVRVPFPVWVTPKAGGGTPMLKALQHACDLASRWAADHPDNYPPVVINVTDGIASGNLLQAVQELTRVSTSDGHALLFNVHISELSHREVIYPSSEADLPDDAFAKQLFSMSSVIPETGRVSLKSMIGRLVSEGARAMILNGDAASVRMMFNFASVVAPPEEKP